MTERTVESVERVLRDDLVHGDTMIAGAGPILRHLLASDDHGLFTDEMIAHIRGMMLDVAWQLLSALAEAADIGDRAAFVAEHQDSLARALLEDTAFLGHAHALALEAQLTEQLQERCDVDPVLPPLVQDLAAAEEPATAALSMTVLAAQARFVQNLRRMELPLGELPGDLFHKALLLLSSHVGQGESDHNTWVKAGAEAAERRLRGGYEEGAGRLALLARLVMDLAGEEPRTLAVDHAGLAIFVTALAMASGQERELTLLSFADRQVGRLALALRAAGLAQPAIDAQFLFLNPRAELPEGFELLPVERAAALLAASRPEAAF